jgi:5-methylcytosine-specific restriction endonuclease McrA
MTSHNFKDETGRTFGELTVLAYLGTNSGRSGMFLCRCACGEEVTVGGQDLRRGHSTRCKKCGRAAGRKHEVGAVVGTWMVVEVMPGDKQTACKYRLACRDCSSEFTRSARFGACQVCVKAKCAAARQAAKAARLAANAARIAAVRQADCHVCGKHVPITGSRVKFCSERCRLKSRRVARRHIYRARAAGVPAERVDVFAVLNEANWTCAECHRETPRELYGTFLSNAPELDHTVALVNGGSHTRDNCRCLCRRCNTQKSFVEGAVVRGSRNMNSKLTTKAVAALLSERKAGVSVVALATKYGVHKKTVRQIVLGRAWRHVPRTTNLHI